MPARRGKHTVKRNKGRRIDRRKGLRVSRKFYHAMQGLYRMQPRKRMFALAGASNAFIKDFTKAVRQLRTKPELVSARHKQLMRKNQRRLRTLVHSKTPIHKKRRILTQKGGFLPFLVPLIAAAVGAAGSLGASAVHAAILKR